jgi:hypothetical protein
MSDTSLVAVMVLSGGLGFILWVGALRAISTIARMSTERRQEREGSAGSVTSLDQDKSVISLEAADCGGGRGTHRSMK